MPGYGKHLFKKLPVYPPVSIGHASNPPSYMFKALIGELVVSHLICRSSSLIVGKGQNHLTPLY
jgi:hypothetical protein